MDPVEGNVGEKIRLVDICFDYKYPTLDQKKFMMTCPKQAEEEGRIIEMSALDVHLDMDESEDDEGAQGANGNVDDDGKSGLHNTLKKKNVPDKRAVQERNPCRRLRRLVMKNYLMVLRNLLIVWLIHN